MKIDKGKDAMSLQSRFEGEDGQRRLIQTLREQRIVEHDEDLAAAIAKVGTVAEYEVGQLIVVQDATDNDVYFILDGEAEVRVNERAIAKRGARECIGEMALVEGAARRSATVAAKTATCALKMSEADFAKIADAFPKIWKPLAKVGAERLRERNKFQRLPNTTPVLFIGSSVEGLPLANEIVTGLKHEKTIVPRVWSTPGVFSAGGVSIDVLLKEVEHADFAAFIFGPDDQIASRKEEYLAPRDNVVFELGLFMGVLDRTRAFVVREEGGEVKIPTDLLGVTPLTYVRKQGQDDPTMLKPVCIELAKLIKKLGPR